MASPEKSLSGKKPEKSSKKSEKKSKKPKHKIKRTIIDHADNGGFVVRHEHHPEEPDMDDQGAPQAPQTPPDETHALGGPNELMDHMGAVTGGQQTPEAPPQGAM